ncbi:MAG: hypothetical protein KGN76_15440 [Acidobacteriota bacterium]|nr:hypothetical protein [Acidobacteriota bacterium]
MMATDVRRMAVGLVLAIALGGTAVRAGAPAQAARPREVAFTLYFVAMSPGPAAHGETIGCGDVIVGHRRTAALSGSDLETAVRAQLTAAPPEGYTNRVAQLGIVLRSVRIDGRQATVVLEPFSMGGMCDGPRVGEQLTRLVRQFDRFDRVAIMVGDRTLARYLSLK